MSGLPFEAAIRGDGQIPVFGLIVATLAGPGGERLQTRRIHAHLQVRPHLLSVRCDASTSPVKPARLPFHCAIMPTDTWPAISRYVVRLSQRMVLPATTTK